MWKSDLTDIRCVTVRNVDTRRNSIDHLHMLASRKDLFSGLFSLIWPAQPVLQNRMRGGWAEAFGLNAVDVQDMDHRR